MITRHGGIPMRHHAKDCATESLLGPNCPGVGVLLLAAPNFHAATPIVALEVGNILAEGMRWSEVDHAATLRNQGCLHPMRG